MGFRVAAIARGSEKESLAKKLGAHHYIDSNGQDPVAALQALGGARLILATAANSKSMSPLLGGLAPRGQLIVAGAGGDEPISVDPVPLLFGMRSLAGTMTGSSIDAEETLSFSSLQGIRPMIETVPLANAAEAYGRMMRNEARFRIVLVTGQYPRDVSGLAHHADSCCAQSREAFARCSSLPKPKPPETMKQRDKMRTLPL